MKAGREMATSKVSPHLSSSHSSFWAGWVFSLHPHQKSMGSGYPRAATRLGPISRSPPAPNHPSCRGWWCSHRPGSCPRAPAPPENFAPSPCHRELRAGGRKIKPSFNWDKNCRIMGNRRADPLVRGHQGGSGGKKSLVIKVIRKSPVVRGHLCLAQPRRGHSRTEVPEVPTPSYPACLTSLLAAALQTSSDRPQKQSRPLNVQGVPAVPAASILQKLMRGSV